jgi:hypothetical protein
VAVKNDVGQVQGISRRGSDVDYPGLLRIRIELAPGLWEFEDEYGQTYLSIRPLDWGPVEYVRGRAVQVVRDNPPRYGWSRDVILPS